MTPAPRHKDFPVGRVCLICGNGERAGAGDMSGAAPALEALGYAWDRTTTLGYAHNRCLLRARDKGRTVTIQGRK